jgi:transposase
MWTLAPLQISDDERAELERRVRAHTTSQRMARRCRIVLLAADGVPNRRIGPEVGMNEHQVGVWRKRFEADRVAGLDDQPRSGRPRVYGHDERLRIVAAATSQKPSVESHWSHRLLAEYLADLGISASQVGRILAGLDIKPHLVRSWISRGDDPTFWERAADVCGLYLSAPQNALVLSVDEKKNIPARTPARPGRGPIPGHVAQRESEYVRNGMLDTLFTAFDVHCGTIMAADTATSNSAANFIGFLEHIDASVDPALEVHLVLDNGASHVAKATAAWLTEHPRFHAHYTPAHASWLNQVEMWFSILSRRLLKRGEFASVDELVERIMAFIEDYNRKAKPFRWTYDGSPLRVA